MLSKLARRTVPKYICCSFPHVYLKENQRSIKKNVRGLSGVTEAIQITVTGVQSFSGLPWWAALTCSTGLVRLFMFPLVLKQVSMSRQLAGAMPELNFLMQLLRQRLASIKVTDTTERLRVTSIFIKGVRACLVLHNVSILPLVAYPAANFSIFVTFIYSLRDMIVNGKISDLADGGMLWFADLTSKDSTFFLPFAAIVCSYGAMDFAFMGSQGRFALVLRDCLQSILLLATPALLPLPAGVFFYWIPSSLFGVVQTIALRHPRIQAFFKLAVPVKPAHLKK